MNIDFSPSGIHDLVCKKHYLYIFFFNMVNEIPIQLFSCRITVRETNTCPLANASALWAGWVENWSGQVEFSIEQIRDLYFWASAAKISHTASSIPSCWPNLSLIPGLNTVTANLHQSTHLPRQVNLTYELPKTFDVVIMLSSTKQVVDKGNTNSAIEVLWHLLKSTHWPLGNLNEILDM